MTKELGYGVLTEICGVCFGKKGINQCVCNKCHKKQQRGENV